MGKNPVNFEQFHIRRLYDDETGTWFFSVVDVVQAFTGKRHDKNLRLSDNKLLLKKG